MAVSPQRRVDRAVPWRRQTSGQMPSLWSAISPRETGSNVAAHMSMLPSIAGFRSLDVDALGGVAGGRALESIRPVRSFGFQAAETPSLPDAQSEFAPFDPAPAIAPAGLAPALPEARTDLALPEARSDLPPELPEAQSDLPPPAFDPNNQAPVPNDTPRQQPPREAAPAAPPEYTGDYGGGEYGPNYGGAGNYSQGEYGPGGCEPYGTSYSGGYDGGGYQGGGYDGGSSYGGYQGGGEGGGCY